VLWSVIWDDLSRQGTVSNLRSRLQIDCGAHLPLHRKAP
jgi:hypothetical protein